MLVRGLSILPRRTVILGRPLLGPKKKKKGGAGGGGKAVTVKVPDPETVNEHARSIFLFSGLCETNNNVLRNQHSF
jgi:formyltetrahydrofolate synthetase